MDPLSDILSLLEPRAYGLRGLNAAGSWTLAFAPAFGVKAYAVEAGSCALAFADDGEAIPLVAGDLALVFGSAPYSLTGGTGGAPIDAHALFRSASPGGVVTVNGGGECRGVGGFFAFDDTQEGMLHGVLPPVVFVRARTSRSQLSALIERLMDEFRAPRPGGALIAQHLLQTLLIEGLRAPVAEGASARANWFAALADPRLRAAITAMHDEPSRPWTLAELAAVARMSRSSFADRFKKKAGETPMAYLTRWRMMLAYRMLRRGSARTTSVARAVGYASDSAFGAAFKRTVGRSPRSLVES